MGGLLGWATFCLVEKSGLALKLFGPESPNPEGITGLSGWRVKSGCVLIGSERPGADDPLPKMRFLKVSARACCSRLRSLSPLPRKSRNEKSDLLLCPLTFASRRPRKPEPLPTRAPMAVSRLPNRMAVFPEARLVSASVSASSREGGGRLASAFWRWPGSRAWDWPGTRSWLGFRDELLGRNV